MATSQTEFNTLMDGYLKKADMQKVFNDVIKSYFEDLAKQEPSDWSKDARTFVQGNELLNGDGKGNFEYKSFLTREEMAAILYRYYTKRDDLKDIEELKNEQE